MNDMLITLPHRRVVRLSGEDVRRFLQGLITQDVNAIDHTPLLFSAMLTPQGKFAFDFFLHHGDDGAIFIDIDAAQADAFCSTLARYKLRSKVTIEQAEGCVQAAWGEAPAGEGWQPDPRHSQLGFRRILAGENAPSRDTTSFYHAHRLSLGIPEGALDGDERSFLLEMGYDQLHGVSFSKGCFIGQEPTARMHYRKLLRKGFFTAHCEDGQTLPASGTPLVAGETVVGEMRSSQGSIGLAFCRYEPWEKAQQQGLPIIAENRPVTLTIPSYMHSKWDSVQQAEKNAL